MVEDPELSERLNHALGGHAQQVYSVAQGRLVKAPGLEEVSTSWERSLNRYGVDPVSSEAPRVLTLSEVQDQAGPLDPLIHSARAELDRLYGLVAEAGYTVLFCNVDGVAVEHRGDEHDASRFRYWGTWLGGVWPESIEGTNGIGTCIIEERPVTVHRGQHFRSRHMDLSCSGAPVFGIDGRLIAVLDVSAIDPKLSEAAHALTGALTVTAARAVEETYFRECFRRDWIVAFICPHDGVSSLLLAVGDGQRIVGANRAARAAFMLDDRRIADGLNLWSIFERDSAPFRRKDGADIAVRLACAGSNETCPALLTPPEPRGGGRYDTAGLALHTRPRMDVVAVLDRLGTAPPRPLRGGLTPAAMRRVHEHVEAHLGESIDLAALAGVAGLSMFHFAREFKQTTGVTPHRYLLQKRVEQARELLASTDLPLAEIAFAVGFADQSHFARRFRQMVGTSPGEFRWSHRSGRTDAAG
ncbi:MAG TPA: helix-turn-helix domain-containing protein [Stellaceae bacterium]|nr:helix-turn-helix domain-containing protein [Stellaceae bacterium]